MADGPDVYTQEYERLVRVLSDRALMGAAITVSRQAGANGTREYPFVVAIPSPHAKWKLDEARFNQLYNHDGFIATMEALGLHLFGFHPSTDQLNALVITFTAMEELVRVG